MSILPNMCRLYVDYKDNDAIQNLLIFLLCFNVWLFIKECLATGNPNFTRFLSSWTLFLFSSTEKLSTIRFKSNKLTEEWLLYVLYHNIIFRCITYRINSTYHIISYHILLCYTIPYRIVSFHILSYYIIPNHTTPHHTMPYHTTPHRTTPYNIIPYHTIPHHTIPHHTIP